MSTRDDLENALRRGSATLPALEPGFPVAVYGAGNCGREVARALRSCGHQVLGFLDIKAGADAEVDGLPCVHPSSDAGARWRKAGAQIVIAVWNPAAAQDEIERTLRAQNWKIIRTLPQIFEQLEGELSAQFWLCHRDLYRDAEVQRQILAAFDLWSDDASRRLFALAIAARLAGDVSALNAESSADVGPQYFPRDVPSWPVSRRFVDGGAFDGDTLRALPWSQIEAVAAFEPDAHSFAQLALWSREAARHREPQPLISLWPCGLWHETTTLRFSDGEGTSSRVSQEGAVAVPVVALDDVLNGFAPDLIKLDIEGAEMQAVRGAREIIERHRPALAICVYHRPEHLWQIALQIAAWKLPYKYFLRAHCANGFDWVLYATA